MTPTEQAAAILAACGSRPGHPLRLAFRGIIAIAIRAAVDQVLPVSTSQMGGVEELCRDGYRAQFLAIADALENPANEV